MICAMVLAAGRSQRMGTQKLVLPVGGQPMVARIVDQLLASPIDRVFAVIGADADSIRAALAGRPVTFVVNADQQGEMLSSVALRPGRVAAGMHGGSDRLGRPTRPHGRRGGPAVASLPDRRPRHRGADLPRPPRPSAAGRVPLSRRNPHPLRNGRFARTAAGPSGRCSRGRGRHAPHPRRCGHAPGFRASGRPPLVLVTAVTLSSARIGGLKGSPTDERPGRATPLDRSSGGPGASPPGAIELLGDFAQPPTSGPQEGDRAVDPALAGVGAELAGRPQAVPEAGSAVGRAAGTALGGFRVANSLAQSLRLPLSHGREDAHGQLADRRRGVGADDGNDRGAKRHRRRNQQSGQRGQNWSRT